MSRIDPHFGAVDGLLGELLLLGVFLGVEQHGEALAVPRRRQSPRQQVGQSGKEVLLLL